MIMTHHPTSARVLWYETQLLVGQPNGGSPKFQGGSPKFNGGNPKSFLSDPGRPGPIYVSGCLSLSE